MPHHSTYSIWNVLRILICAFAVIYLVGPIVVVVIISFSAAPFLMFPPPGYSLRWYDKLFGDPVWRDALFTSIRIMIPTALLATAAGTAAAYGFARARFRGSTALSALMLTPIVVPVIITAAGMFGVFQDFNLYGTWTGLILAHTVLAMPYVFVTVSAGLRVIDPVLEAAAMTLGAPPRVAFFRVVLPLIKPAIQSGLLFALVVSFDEVIVSLFISTPRIRPVSVQMWSDVLGQVDPTIAAVATLLLAFSTLVVVVEYLVRKGRPVTPGA
ncbi:MAG: ABC transporter permease [Pseudorhodoplanes sp.]